MFYFTTSKSMLIIEHSLDKQTNTQTVGQTDGGGKKIRETVPAFKHHRAISMKSVRTMASSFQSG